MKKKELLKFDIIEQLRQRNPYTGTPADYFYTIDGGFSGDVEKIDLTKTSGNLCFRFDYFPTGCENIYHDIFVEDWTTKKRYKAGYIYFKTYTGYFTAESMKELARIVKDAQQILEDVYEIINREGENEIF